MIRIIDASTRLFAAIVVLGALGGCTPDIGEPRPGPCGQRAIACHNGCYKLELGAACHNCCDYNFDSCSDSGPYQFSSCPDKE
jgi:hypothetical protein